MEKYLYLFLDIISFIIPFLFATFSQSRLSLKPAHVLPAILFPAIIFILWDNWFTGMGVWGFNPRYLTGYYAGNLPLEEVLFFLCIPYACLFTYQAVRHLKTEEPLPNNGQHVTWVLIIGLLLTGLKNYDLWYTSVTFISASLLLLFQLVVMKVTYLGRFYFSFIFILIPFFIINGVLTGTGIPEPVVWYNNNENLGIRMLTIPIEDTFYGMLLILMNVSIFEYLRKRTQRSS